LFIAPSLLLFLLVLAFPIGYAIYLAFFDVAPNFSLHFVGALNFEAALQQESFWNALSNTLVYSFVSVALHLVIGFGLAILLNLPWLRGRLLFRIAFLIPWTISLVVTSVTWRWLLDAQFGVVNWFLQLTGLSTQGVSWLGTAETALPMAILVNVWRGYPFVMVMLYAGLQLVPADLKEAAEVDGASRTQVFRHVTLPSLRTIILIATVLDFIWVFIQFDLIKVLTAGGPARHTEMLSNLIYRTAFEELDFGAGSAVATLMLAIVLGFSLIYARLLRDREA
jgi:multiple sugar transport system permease protein